MTILNDVINLIDQLSPDPICDDCIKVRLNLSVRQHANHKTRELEKTAGYDRRIDICSICGNSKKVIRNVS